MGSWVGPWVPFSKLSRQKAIETCEILIEQRDRQIRRAEAAETKLAAVEAERDTWCTGYHNAEAATRRAEAKLAEVEAERDEHRTERHRLMKLISVRESAWDAAEARLAEVEAMCEDGTIRDNWTATRVLAAARGEGDRGE